MAQRAEKRCALLFRLCWASLSLSLCLSLCPPPGIQEPSARQAPPLRLHALRSLSCRTPQTFRQYSASLYPRG